MSVEVKTMMITSKNKGYMGLPDFLVYYEVAILTTLKPWFDHNKNVCYDLEEEFVHYLGKLMLWMTKKTGHHSKHFNVIGP